jgi:hypothetical protein
VWTWVESEQTPGFVAEAQCQPMKLVAGLDLIATLGPRLHVSVSQPKSRREIDALAKLPLGQKLYGLRFIENDAQWVNDGLMTTIAPALSGLRSLQLDAWEARASDEGWGAMLPHLTGLEQLTLSLGANPERWIELLLASSLPKSLKSLSVPGWLPPALQKRLQKAIASVEFRRERRNVFNRATGFYLP